MARLVATAQSLLVAGESPAAVEAELTALERDAPAYASRDASLALADLEWRTGRREQAAARYRDLAEVISVEPLRRFCRRRGAGPG